MKPLFILGFLLTLSIGLNAQNTNGYCLNKGTRGNAWLQKVSIGNWSSNTGSNSGYFYQADSKLVLNADTSYTLQLEMGGYPRIQDSAYWRVWIDLNQDLDFEDDGEQVAQLKTVHKGVARGTISLPQALKAGDYVLRVTVSKSKFSAACSTDATILESEDYGFKINAAPPCPRPIAQQIRVQKIKFEQAVVRIKDANATRYNWHVLSENGKYSQYFWGISVDSLQLSALSNNTIYKVQVQTECEAGKSRWSDYAVFKTFGPGALCSAIDEASIVVDQPSNKYLRFNCTNPDVRTLEWRYRTVGESNWASVVQSKGPTSDGVEAFFPVSDTTCEIQVRNYCSNQFIFSEWSEVIYKETKSCVLPPQQDVFIAGSFSLYPDLKMNAYSNRHELKPFNITWQYRESGDSTWIGTLQLSGIETRIPNLAPVKKYDIKAILSCSGDSVAVVKQIEMPPSCEKINPYSIKIVYIQDSSALVVVTNEVNRNYEVRYRAVGDSVYVISPLTIKGIYGLKPDHEYELSVRVVCEDSIPDWSDPVFFANPVCLLPEHEEIALLKFHSLDSARFNADFLDFTGKDNFIYIWRYKIAKTKTWITPEINGGKEFVLTKMQAGTKYELQVSIICPNNLADSLSFTSSFTAQAGECTEKPPLSLIKVESYPNWPGASIRFLAPKGNKFQIRTRPEGSNVYRGYFQDLEDSYSYGFSLFPGINDFQFRLICPNGNVSPWSDIIKLRNYVNGAREAEPSELTFKTETTLLEASPQHQLRIAPNPSSGQLSILFPAEMEPQPEAKLEILSTAGQRIWSLKTSIAPAQTLPIDLSQQTPGLYILRIQAGQKVYTERIMIASNR